MRCKTLCITVVALATSVQTAFKSLAFCVLLLSFGAAARADQFTFRTIDFPGADSTWGLAISPRGEIGGLACVGPSCQGFLLGDGTNPVNITPPGASSSYVTGIQPGGFLLAGQYNDGSGNAHGYVLNRLRPNAFTPIDPDPNGVLFTEVADMNPSGDLAGWYADLAGIGHGYVVLQGSLTSFDIPGATFTGAFGISPGGDLVGTYCDAPGCHAYLLRGGISGALTTIDVPDAAITDAFGINSLGQIVGDYCTSDGTCHGYLRNSDGELITVDPPGSDFVIAFAINPAGQITGLSCDDSGCHAFLAAPQHGPAFQTTTVPTMASGRPSTSSTLNSVRRLRPLGKGGLARLVSKP
jgi:hypothetical protein